MPTTISLPFNGHTQFYNRDRVATAYLVMLDRLVTAGRRTPTLTDTVEVSRILRREHQFGLDAASYAIAARICIENGIEP